MSTGFLHLHVFVTTLFLLFLAFKVVLLVLNKTSLLETVRNKTKVVDMILGALLLITGIGLLVFKGSVPAYMTVKIVAVLAAIPLGIIGLKKGNKLLAVLSLVLIVYIYGVAETKSYKFKKDKITVEQASETIIEANADTQISNGKAIYEAACVECHGTDGKKGLFKAADLTASALSREEKINIISKGKGTMQAYEDLLSAQDIESVVSYIETLK